MKVVTTIFLTITIFLQTFSTYIIQADFFLNRSYIAKNLCVNREKPRMQCNGKCYLSKKLKEQENQDQQVPVSKNEQFNIQPFFVPAPFLLMNTSITIKVKFFIKNDQAIASFPEAIFHPPTA